MRLQLRQLPSPTTPATVKPLHAVAYDGHAARPTGSQLINRFSIDGKEYRAVDGSVVNGDIAVIVGNNQQVSLNPAGSKLDSTAFTSQVQIYLLILISLNLLLLLLLQLAILMLLVLILLRRNTQHLMQLRCTCFTPKTMQVMQTI